MCFKKPFRLQSFCVLNKILFPLRRIQIPLHFHTHANISPNNRHKYQDLEYTHTQNNQIHSFCLYRVQHIYLKWLSAPQNRMFTFVMIHFPFLPKGLSSWFMYVSKNVILHYTLHNFCIPSGRHKSTFSEWHCSYFYDLCEFHFQQLIMPAVTVRWFLCDLFHLLMVPNSLQRPGCRTPSFSPSVYPLSHIQSFSPDLLYYSC